ncbi:iron-siderophore ABC transporter substrate-binding protein [Microbacterium marinilacus]|uniref:Iron-siderophore ABC transporter substrate-binding protein n=1 Tax=Microbacterium marinilacus TaxID=415209 RepID=A0ABP7BC57_9MICO|nr:iron-siderophore ABC transporter substrate-binding protein [Microbacterium marinilacus]MBY0689412.1 iron-siderophore ABC transporter substrate-binding protein [Microbacterium marinilacus]
MRSLRGLAVVAVVGALALTACSSPAADEPAADSSAGSADSGYPVTIPTNFGDVTIDEKPERVVALGWGDAELALAFDVQPVGAADWLAFGGEGVGPWSEGLYDEAPEILGTLELSYEAVAALEPDLILDVRGAGDAERYERLSSIATTVGVSEGGEGYKTRPDEQVRMVGAALGQPERAEEMLAEVDAAFAEVTEAHPEWAGKTFTAATRTSEGWGAYFDDARSLFLEDLGFVPNETITDLSDTSENGWSVKISPEQLDLLDADLIVAFPIWIETTEITEDAGWQQIPAVEDGRAVVIDGNVSQSFSLGTPASKLYAIENLVPLLEDAID